MVDLMSTDSAKTKTIIGGLPALPAPPPVCSRFVPPLSIGALRLATPFLLAPLAGYTNLAFRLAIRELGCLGLATTDLVNARALLRANRKTRELIQTSPEDRPLAVQIYGQDPAEMTAAAHLLESYGISSVDINMGCPVHKVVRGGGGSALMCEPRKAISLVRTVVRAIALPVTVKMRLGWDDQNWSAPYFARAFEDVGAAAVTVHGRTRSQGFGGRVSLEGIRAVAAAVRNMPVIGNGDIRTPAQALRMIDETGCTGVAIGRGALLNPWIFGQAARLVNGGPNESAPGYAERVDFMERHFRLLVHHRGERFGCLTFRKVANWYCKVLRPSRPIQQALVRLENSQQFDDLVDKMRSAEQLGEMDHLEGTDVPIHLPSGPVEHW
jgi:nifR3 family TIM-barrel protein